MRTMFPLLLSGVSVFLTANLAWARGEEHFGNEPLNAANYTDWPGVMPVVNHPSRAYHTWVNGNEHFYYAGDVDALNDVLQEFSQAKAKTLEVVLRPGSCETQSFEGQTVPYDWMLHLVGGIAQHMSRKDKGENIWSPHPVLTICIGDEIQVSALRIPEALKVTGLDDLKKRYAAALSSKDQTVRGWGAGALAALDPHDAKSAARIAELLEDEEDWVRLNSAGALAVFGERAEAELLDLRSALTTNNQQLKERIETAIERIETDNRPPDVYEKHERRMTEIRNYLDSRRDKRRGR